MISRFTRSLVLFTLLGFLHVPSAAAQTADSQSLDEVNKELSNPISSIWALQLQENTYWLNKPDRNVVNLQFQPVLPLALSDDWNLITRPVFQVMNSTPYVNESFHLHRVTGFGDTILATLLSPSPKLAGPWLLGAGPSFIFPTATNSRLGQNKWQLGPAGVFGYLGDKWLAGVFPQQWFSVGGNGSQTVSQMNLQYFFVYLPGDGWGIGTSPNMLVNWYASNANKVTFPIGLNISKVVKIGPLPVKFAVQGQYMPVRPDVFGQKWNLQFAITPVIPKLIKGPLFGG
ncbi:hypothetical protein [Candidatus Binatus sp.]|uniref:hypothetical protein n=1 Tax=Candidatus Binatus sp. TaxID=2811406 RepID=UPI003C27FD2F